MGRYPLLGPHSTAARAERHEGVGLEVGCRVPVNGDRSAPESRGRKEAPALSDKGFVLADGRLDERPPEEARAPRSYARTVGSTNCSLPLQSGHSIAQSSAASRAFVRLLPAPAIACRESYSSTAAHMDRRGRVTFRNRRQFVLSREGPAVTVGDGGGSWPIQDHNRAAR